MPKSLRSALALSTFLVVAGGGAAFAQVVTGTGDITPTYNLETDGAFQGGSSTDVAALQSEIDGIMNDAGLSESEKQAAINTAVQNATSSSGGAACAQQLDDLSYGLEVASTAVELGGTIAEAVGAVLIVTEIPGVILQGVGTGLAIGQVAVTGVQNSLPNCSAEFTGTVETWANFAAAQGVSAFDGAVTLGNDDGVSYYEGITLGGGNLAGAGDGGAHAITGHVDAIAIGNGAEATSQNGTALGTNAYSSGIGATALGAETDAVGVGATAVGYDANATGDDATAIGAGANANGVGATALGADSNAAGASAAALGTGANATAADAVAVGDADATAVNAVAAGNAANASAAGATAVGTGSTASGAGSSAVGENANATGQDSAALGDADATQFRSLAIGQSSSSTASGAAAFGSTTGGSTTASGTDALAVQGGSASGASSIAVGVGSSATQASSLAIGTGASSTGARSIAVGYGATATGSVAIGNMAFAQNGGAAFGDFARAEGTASAAFGPNAGASGHYATASGANTRANGNGSVAIGADSTGGAAMANLSNQFVLGTSNHTYTAAGIGSDLSKARQVGQVNVVTNDAFGNLADDGGEIFRRLDEHDSGIAMAMAMENPSLGPGERFGIATAWGTFAGAHALTASAMGVIGEGMLTEGDRIALFGGFGAGFEHGRGETVLGGRAGLQWTY